VAASGKPPSWRWPDRPGPEAGAEARRLIERWGRQHAGRGGLGATSTLAFLWAALG
jgi:hypothetical protein